MADLLSLNIDNELAKHLLKSLENEVVENGLKINELELANSKLRDTINQIKLAMASKNIKNPSSIVYQPQWTIFRKILFLLDELKRPLSTREIVDEIIEVYEPNLRSERAKLVSNISGVLSTKCKEGKLIKGENVLGENVYSKSDNTKLF